MSAKHTPGPWWLKAEYSTVYVEAKAREHGLLQEVAAVGPKEGGTEQQAADARLMAAAPDLLEALLQLTEAADTSDDCQYGTLSTSFVRDIARAAIARATGEQP